jgi:hypothetical protein
MGDLIYQLRYNEGSVEAVDEQRGLTAPQLEALNNGRARLVVLNEHLEEVVLAEVQPSGEVMILAGLPSKKS